MHDGGDGHAPGSFPSARRPFGTTQHLSEAPTLFPLARNDDRGFASGFLSAGISASDLFADHRGFPLSGWEWT